MSVLHAFRNPKMRQRTLDHLRKVMARIEGQPTAEQIAALRVTVQAMEVVFGIEYTAPFREAEQDLILDLLVLLNEAAP